MTVTHLLAQHQWLREDGLVENAVVNTFSFIWDDTGDYTDDGEVVDAIEDMMNAFYSNFADDYSSYMTGARTLKVYDRSDPEPRSPIGTRTLSVLSVSGSRAPGEIAICASFQGAIISGGNRARRRGRVYLGPFGPTAFLSVTSGTRPTTDVTNEIIDAMEGLFAASELAAGFGWEVWSPTDNAGVPVSNGWVDNAFDTMRSRGIAPSARVVWPSPA